MLITESIDRYLDYVAHQRRLSPLSVDVYSRELHQFADYLHTIGIDSLDELTTREPRSWQAIRMDEGLKATSIKKMLSALRGWSRYLLHKQWVAVDLMAHVSQPRTPKPLPVFFKESEVEHIYEASRFPDTYDGELDKLVLRMLYETGMRRSELAYLTLQNIDLTAHTVKVRGKRNKERIIPIEEELAHNISRYLALRAEMLEEQMRKNPQIKITDRLLVNSRGREVSDGMIYTIVEPSPTPTARVRMCSVTPLPPTCSTRVPTSMPSKNCWATAALPPQRYIRM